MSGFFIYFRPKIICSQCRAGYIDLWQVKPSISVRKNLAALSTEQSMLTYGKSEHKYLPNPEQEMSNYDRSEHECLPRTEQHKLIGDNLDHVFLLRPKQNLGHSGSEQNFVQL